MKNPAHFKWCYHCGGWLREVTPSGPKAPFGAWSNGSPRVSERGTKKKPKTAIQLLHQALAALPDGDPQQQHITKLIESRKDQEISALELARQVLRHDQRSATLAKQIERAKSQIQALADKIIAIPWPPLECCENVH